MYKYITVSILAVIGLYYVNEIVQEEYSKYVEQNKCINKHVKSNIERVNNSCKLITK